MEKGNYKKFFLMLGVSFVIMYGVMFLNADKFDHVYLNLNRLYMALLMIAPMALVMLGFMTAMYKDKKLNAIIVGGSLVVLVGAFIMLRNQAMVDDKQFLKSMIPHHSSAILVSQEANISDPEVKELTKQIIESQEKEIAEMKTILERMK
jgi:cytochrome c biogenesis factor